MNHQVNPRIRLVLSLLFMVMVGWVQAATITVGPGADYDFKTIQAGIDVANDDDTVLVAPGEYVISEPITFLGKAITVQSEAGPNETTIRMGTPAVTNRGSVVIFENNEITESVLEGFTITGGKGFWFPSVNAFGAGGILFNASSGTVRDCAIVQNSTDYGGGIACAYACSPKLIDCIIAENLAGMDGGGVFLWQGPSLTMVNCTITANSANNTGGGLNCYQNSQAILINCVISSNTVTGASPPVAGYGGGIICNENSLLTLSNCNIIENSAGIGCGGLLCDNNSQTTMNDCIIIGNTAGVWGGGAGCAHGTLNMTSCVIASNSAEGGGGGLVGHEADDSITISNCTIWGNSGGSDYGGGGIACYGGSSAKVINSIIWENTSARGQEIFLQQNPTVFSIMYCNVAGGQSTVNVEGGILNWDGSNIDVDPLFADAVINDYHLKSQAGRWDPKSSSWVKDDVTSPCVDTGDPGSDWSGEIWPHGERINMGAYGGTREASMSTRPEAMSLPRVAFIYRSDTEEAESFQSLLMSYGCSTTLIGVDDVATTALDSYDVMIVANDMGYIGTWGDAQSIAAIEDSGKPIIGLGQGGYDFFGVLELWIGRPNGGHGSENSIGVLDPNCSLFSTPYSVDIPEDRILQLYTETNHIGIYLWPTIPETVTVLASVVNDTGYFPLVMEHNRYLLWGFTESPEKMTEVGKILFINFVIWTANEGWETEI